MISLRDVSVRLGEVEALRDVSLELGARTIAVIGDNGSGKSTFARLLAGLVPATSGTLRVLGLDPTRDADELRRRVAVVFSNPDAQIVMPTVAEDVAFSLRPQRRPRRGTGDADAAAQVSCGAPPETWPCRKGPGIAGQSRPCRRARPGVAPVASTPSTTGVPFTRTISIPHASSRGFS